MLSISFDKEQRVFHLTNGKISYIMQLFHENYLGHLYYGKALEKFNANRLFLQTEREGAPQPHLHAAARIFSLDSFPQEYPNYGTGDYRIPAIEAVLADGTTALDLRYVEHTIFEGKKALESLPSSYVNKDEDALTLEITLKDIATDLYVILSYTLIEGLSLILRHSRIINKGEKAIKLKRAHSIALDFLDEDFERIHLYGKHAHERQIERVKLNHGIDTVSSARGATSHQHQNFLALARPDTTEHTGEVYGTTLVWSGNFEASTELSSFGNVRMVMGINPFDFSWILEQNECFTTPEAVCVYSDEGLNGMSHTFHKFVRENIVRGHWAKKPRPILVNSWEAAYFNFTEESIVRFAKDAVKLGAELIVLDDGWFGKRNKDNCSLGDWVEIDYKKLPNGIKGLADKIHDMGAMFGLWVEPEMVSPDSNLFRAHPDWALGIKGRERSQGRDQYVLDLSRQDVRDYIVDSICKVLGSAKIDYVKWDHNRNLTEIASYAASDERQMETATRYVYGVYDIMSRITSAFPQILFESCAGGGRRFDMGILSYMPQVWTSDNTDEVCRQRIQYGTSLIFPPLTMGAHVSACPNHQVGRTTPMNSRFICAMSGNFGYEMDLGKLSEEEQEEVKSHIALYKELRNTIQFGSFTRLLSPFDTNQHEAAWQFISEDKTEVCLMYFRNMCQPQTNLRHIRLRDLEAKASYKVTKHLLPKMAAFNPYLTNFNLEGEEFSGQELMYNGFTMDKVDADYVGYLIVLKKI